jgi:hypothetical protein
MNISFQLISNQHNTTTLNLKVSALEIKSYLTFHFLGHKKNTKDLEMRNKTIPFDKFKMEKGKTTKY